MKNLQFQKIKTLTCMLLAASCGLGVSADELKSFEELNNFLKPEPYIELGTDGILVQLPEDTPERIASGQAVYTNNCAVCHGKKLQGQDNWNKPLPSGQWLAPPHDKSGHTWHHADDQLFEYVKYGPAVALDDPNFRSAMPSFKSVLTDEEILAVLVFIRSSWPKRERSLQDATNDDRSGR